MENGDAPLRGKNKNPVLLLALRVPFSDDIGYLREYWKDVPRGQRCQFSMKIGGRRKLTGGRNDGLYLFTSGGFGVLFAFVFLYVVLENVYR